MFSNKKSQILFSVVAAAGLWLLLIVLGFLVPNDTQLYRFIEVLGGTSRGVIQAMIYCVFIYSLFELRAKRSYIQEQQEGFHLGLLPLQDQLVISPEEVAQIKLKTLKLEKTGHMTMVGDFVKKACTQYRNDNSVGETLQVFNAQVDVSKEAMEGDLEIVRYLLSAIISLGFIGTLIGLSGSIGLAHLSKTAEGMPIITQSLNVAFDTTLVALLAGLILNFLYHRYLKEMDTFYSEAKSYVINNLISRIYVA
ncbi:MAG: MotA/TolQ/ExbB proton channel family protein [Bacteroidota bacterium]